MFEPRHVLGLPSLLAIAIVLGSTPGGSEARAESLTSALNALSPGVLGQAESDPPSEPAQDQESELADGDVPFSELNEALSAARARLTELTKAAEIAKVASQLREELEAAKAENLELKATLKKAEATNSVLVSENQAALERVSETEVASSEATAEARRLDEELVALRWQNSQLSTSLARAESSASDAGDKLETIKTQTAAEIEALTKSLEGAAAEMASLKIELDATRESALIAEQRGADLDAQLAQLSVGSSEAQAKAAKLTEDLDVTITELGETRTELTTVRQTLDDANLSLTAANQEAAVLREQSVTNREITDKLRQDLEKAEAELQLASASNEGLREQVKILRVAAGEATDAARLNLLAVENQIDEINAALATVKGDESGSSDESSGISAAIEGADNDNAVDEVKVAAATPPEVASAAAAVWVPKLSPARSTAAGQQQLIAANSPAPSSSFVANNPPAASSPLANRVINTNIEAQSDATADPIRTASLVTDLPDERRQKAAALLEDLNASLSDRGLTMTVPGTILFAVNSDEIGQDAHETLAKVAEMVDLYADRDVLIIGHTDAVGDDDYNQELSERRAELVKTYFVDELDIAKNRLSVEGEGERRPITSNATAEGRDANRRVEVIVLN